MPQCDNDHIMSKSLELARLFFRSHFCPSHGRREPERNVTNAKTIFHKVTPHQLSYLLSRRLDTSTSLPFWLAASSGYDCTVSSLKPSLPALGDCFAADQQSAKGKAIIIQK